MPFQFSYVCDLLQRLDDNQGVQPGVRTSADIIQEWFQKHQGLLHRQDHDTAALLSTLLPEKRSDRVYFIREKKLQTVIGRGLGLGRSRIATLGRWDRPSSGIDLGDCVERPRPMKANTRQPNPTQKGASVEEIDQLLHGLASTCRFSSPAVRSSAFETRLTDREQEIRSIYKRLSARDAKWFTRLILKNFEPVVLDPQLVYRSYHPLLPVILKVQDDLSVASHVLASIRRDRSVTGKASLAGSLKPTLGVKIGRQQWIKGRGINHCLDMSHGRMACEEKVDGEYCQIHIDLSKGASCIQIFSKSGKDSTADRIALHKSIRKSLQLGTPSCPIQKGCILEGELVVYSDKDSKILDFHKIRKHVSRSGSFIGTDQDSQRHSWEHLMIVYYDLFMVDGESLLAAKQSERFKRLEELVTLVPGRSALVKREIIDSDKRSAASDLRRALAKYIVARGEGLVLKPDDPYFDFSSSRKPYSCCAIKLKKGCIGGFGDIGDFAVVGARFDAAKARVYNISSLKWTHFYVGCLENKDEVNRFKRQPRFVVTNVVELNATQLQTFMTFVNPPSMAWADNTATDLRIEPGVDNGKRPSVVFPAPPVFDLRCFSFDKGGNTGFWSPRFPMVNKIHCDRTFHDTLSFGELQDMARKEKELPPPEDSQELLGWIASLETSDPQSTAVDSSSQTTGKSTSQSTISTARDPTALWSQSSNINPPDILTTLLLDQNTEAVSGREIPSSPSTVYELLPPPGSSAIQGANTNLAGLTVAESPQKSPKGRKRASESFPQTTASRNKLQRCSDDQAKVATSSSSSSSANSPRDRRRPLSDINSSSSRRNKDSGVPVSRLVGVNSMYQPNLETGYIGPLIRVRATLQASLSFHGSVSGFPPIPPSATRRASGSSISNTRSLYITPTQVAETLERKCRYLDNSCTLSGFSFLLSPCISGYLLVTEDLLGFHAITDFARDPKEWCDCSAVREKGSVTPSSSDPGAIKRPKPKKIVLVDKRRKEATAVFLARIREAGLMHSNGRKEYVPVYDWRVLDTLKEEEEESGKRGKISGPRFEAIWRKSFIALV
ncbi:hypothetical protein B0H67DRAFT_599510 [Lasiosphaeris hirsuta]|uniref:ATP-dependent DNA ligase family profile domain-containing protein n=1 Tax=Lasiosphaeris hirsuta TaxID=260670 RepID=A0AA40AQ15_9PEZI|nr:hypothetical protein B0H67DRAFT_599510 [Lasiosphaeris hirsuta]